MAIFDEKIEIRERFIFVYFFTQTDPTRTVQRNALCRSRRELSKEYLFAKIGVDTAENEPLEVWWKIIQYYSFVSLVESRSDVHELQSARATIVPTVYLNALPQHYQTMRTNEVWGNRCLQNALRVIFAAS